MKQSAPLTSAFASLSDRQRLCLRLIGRGLTSKEIALETGLTPQTVDTYIKSAMAKLNASSRREAARALQGHEARLSQQLGSPPQAVAATAPTRHPEATAGRGGIARALIFPPLGGRRNELTLSQRTFAVLRVAGVSAIVLSALVLLIAGVMMTFR